MTLRTLAQQTGALIDAKKYVKWILRQTHVYPYRNMVLSGEGGFRGAVRNCLAEIALAGDVEEGLAAYYRRIRNEYLRHKIELDPSRRVDWSDVSRQAANGTDVAAAANIDISSFVVSFDVILEENSPPQDLGCPIPSRGSLVDPVGRSNLKSTRATRMILNDILDSLTELEVAALYAWANTGSMIDASTLTGLSRADIKRLVDRVRARARRRYPDGPVAHVL